MQVANTWSQVILLIACKPNKCIALTLNKLAARLQPQGAPSPLMNRGNFY